MTTIDQALREAAARLAAHETARLDAELLLAHVLGRPRTYLYAWPERELDVERAAAFDALVARRAAGEPVAYLVGAREFWSRALAVTPATLIPRPETELLVEAALERIPVEASWRVADLGTGSGAIAIAVAAERPACALIATDRSAAALAVAQSNAERHVPGQVSFVCADWLAPFRKEAFDLIAANPPYVAQADPHLALGDVRFEPVGALAAGPDGLDAIRRIVAETTHCLRPGGWLLVEHGYDQAAAVAKLLDEKGFLDIACLRDPAGQPRVSLGRRPGGAPSDT